VGGLIRQEEHGTIVRELDDGHAETLRERDPSEPGARLFEVFRRHRRGIVASRPAVAEFQARTARRF